MSSFSYFGKNASHYAQGRYGYPLSVIAYLRVYVLEKDRILDIGAGTGISTRQLARSGFEDVSGVDVDDKMLDIARGNPEFRHIPYYTADVKKLPFKSHSMKAVTCFSSFHWFSDADSLKEIRRILKPQGIIFIANKYDKSPFTDTIKKKIEEKYQLTFPVIKKLGELKESLEKSHFKVIPEKKFEGMDPYTLDQAVEYIKSVSFWNFVPENLHEEILQEIILPELESKIEKGRIQRHYDTVCLIAIKE